MCETGCSQTHKVPPIVITLLRNQELARKYDLSSIRFLYTGAAPLGPETVAEVMRIYPHWHVGQGYGMTETATGICSTQETDILHGSSGSLLPGGRAKIVDTEGNEVTEYEKTGELLFQGPAVTIGYLNNEKATAETFVWDNDGRWIRTGDEVLVRLSEKGNEHFVIVDRMKELIKVKVCFPFRLSRKAPVVPPTPVLTGPRATKSHLLSWKLTSSPTPPSRTALSSRCPTTPPARFPRPTSSRRATPRAPTTRSRGRSRSTSRSTRRGTSG